jgi:hypothetical protein
MTIILFPDVRSCLRDVPPNIMIARCLIAAFVILAVGLAVNQIRCMRQRMRQLDDAMRAHSAEDRALDEVLCGANLAASHSAPKQKRDPWEN